MLCIIAAASKIAKIFIVYKVNYALISFPLLFPQLLSNKSPERKEKQNCIFSFFHVMHQMHLWCNPTISQLNTQGAFGPC